MAKEKHRYKVNLPTLDCLQVRDYNKILGGVEQETTATSPRSAATHVIARHFPNKVPIIAKYIEKNLAPLEQFVSQVPHHDPHQVLKQMTLFDHQ